jgi:tetratricopeptide (TPR) repeat protein
MKALRNLLILLAIIVVIGFVVPGGVRNGYLNYWYGRLLEMKGDLGGASQAYENASDAMVDNATFARAQVRTLNDLGEEKEETSYFDDAFKVADSWIKDHENHEQVWQLYVEKARAEWGQGKKNVARFSIDKAVELMPTDYVALVYQGIIYRDTRPDNRESVRRSIPIFEQAIAVRRETRTAWAHYELAVAFWMVRDEQGALNEINQTLSQWPPRWLRQKAERLKHQIQSGGRSER